MRTTAVPTVRVEIKAKDVLDAAAVWVMAAAVGPLAVPVKVAVTLWAADIGTAQSVTVPEQPPPEKPLNSEPGEGAAIR
jgi:hypothetical protein